jgi:hypothetical protein
LGRLASAEITFDLQKARAPRLAGRRVQDPSRPVAGSIDLSRRVQSRVDPIQAQRSMVSTAKGIGFAVLKNGRNAPSCCAL